MPNSVKKDTVRVLVDALNERGSVVLVDYKGLTHAQMTDVRNKVFEAGGTLKVVKNNLFMIALKDAKLPSPEEELVGPTAVLFTSSDNPAPIKTLYTEGKALENLTIKWGVWDKELVDEAKVVQLASLPSRDELIAKLVGQLKSPQARLVFSLKGNLQKLVLALSEIRNQKETMNS